MIQTPFKLHAHSISSPITSPGQLLWEMPSACAGQKKSRTSEHWHKQKSPWHILLEIKSPVSFPNWVCILSGGVKPRQELIPRSIDGENFVWKGDHQDGPARNAHLLTNSTCAFPGRGFFLQLSALSIDCHICHLVTPYHFIVTFYFPTMKSCGVFIMSIRRVKH